MNPSQGLNSTLHAFCAFRHLVAEVMRVFINCEKRAEIEDEAQAPCRATDQNDGGLQVEGVGDDAGEDGGKSRARVLDEIFNRLRRGADFGDGYIIHCRDDVRRGERHEERSETH